MITGSNRPATETSASTPELSARFAENTSTAMPSTTISKVVEDTTTTVKMAATTTTNPPTTTNMPTITTETPTTEMPQTTTTKPVPIRLQESTTPRIQTTSFRPSFSTTTYLPMFISTILSTIRPRITTTPQQIVKITPPTTITIPPTTTNPPTTLPPTTTTILTTTTEVPTTKPPSRRRSTAVPTTTFRTPRSTTTEPTTRFWRETTTIPISTTRGGVRRQTTVLNIGDFTTTARSSNLRSRSRFQTTTPVLTTITTDVPTTTPYIVTATSVTTDRANEAFIQSTIPVPVTPKRKELTEQQKQDLATLAALEKEQQAILKQLSFLTNLV